MTSERSIRKKLIMAIILTSGIVSLLTCAAFFAYEVITFRQTTMLQLSTLAEIVATNSTAALAFESRDEAEEILSALKAEPHVQAAVLYDQQGEPFASYPASIIETQPPITAGDSGYHFRDSHLEGFERVMLGTRPLGTLFMRADTGALTERLQLYAVIVSLVLVGSILLAYVISERLQRRILEPVLTLADTAQVVTNTGNYALRATRNSRDEVGHLTDSFNQMLDKIQAQNEAITLFNQQLEKRVQERTSELEVANKDMESFSYSVSHDLRAPLRSIYGYMSILIEDYGHLLDDEGKRLMGIVNTNATRMGRLIDDLLEFSKLGRREVAYSNIDVRKMVENVVKDVVERMESAPEIILHPLPVVHADHILLEQVWVNLVSNAIKYSSKKDNPKVEIGYQADEKQIIFFVKDNGAGFNMDYASKLFGVFQRLHKATEFEGTGVGLAIVHRVITKHGGKVWAQGEIDKGATFFFSLPASMLITHPTAMSA